MALLSIREYARQRGVSHPAVLKRVKSGKITLVDGKIDPEIADREWSDSRDEQQFERGGHSGKEKSEVAVSPAKEKGSTYNDLQRAEKALKIKRDQLRLKREEGTVIPADLVARTWSALIQPTKTRLLGIGAKLGPLLAIEQDAAACQAMIDGAMYEALAEIAEYRPNA